YGDSLTDVDFGEVLRALPEQADGVMTVLANGDRWDQSNVVFQDGRLLRYDKRQRTPDMAYIDYGVSLLRARALARLAPATPADVADLYSALVGEGRMTGFEVLRRFYEIGSPAGLEDTRRFIEEQRKMSYVDDYLDEAVRVTQALDRAAI